MSSNIWTRCAGTSEFQPLALSPWRAVEAQHLVSTRKLVDSADEQILLEELIDRAKPPDRTGGTHHYLLSTPFRYPPLRHGSRFGSRHERGIWYGSETRQHGVRRGCLLPPRVSSRDAGRHWGRRDTAHRIHRTGAFIRAASTSHQRRSRHIAVRLRRRRNTPRRRRSAPPCEAPVWSSFGTRPRAIRSAEST